jgi:hypothetical protein
VTVPQSVVGVILLTLTSLICPNFDICI